MADKKYNGWTNYQTWAVKLWLDNDEGTVDLQRELLEQAQNTPFVEGYSDWTRKITTRYILAALLKDYVTDNNPLDIEAVPVSMYTDLMGSAIDDVNFREIAEHIIDDAESQTIAAFLAK
jgi:hypothetical protein